MRRKNAVCQLGIRGRSPDCGFYRSVGRLWDGGGVVNARQQKKCGGVLILYNMAYASSNQMQISNNSFLR